MILSNEQKEILQKNDFWKGKYCFKYQLPWITPESTIFIDKLLSDNMNVMNECLEIGSGGSTLYLQNRCGNIVSIERDIKFCNNENIVHISYIRELENFLQNKKTLYNIVVLDSHLLDCKREDIFHLIIKFFKLENSIFVIDNYNSSHQFPNINKLSHEELRKNYFSDDFIIKDYDHPKWARDSKGTRIIYHQNLIK